MAEATVAAPKPIPAFFDENNQIIDLNRSDFDRGRDGKIAFLTYRVTVAKARLEEFLQGENPFNAKKRKIEKLRKKLAQLEKELAENPENAEE